MKAFATAMHGRHSRDSGQLSVSLRGTLAAHFMQMYRAAGAHAAHAFVCQLLDSENPNIVQVMDGALLVVGLASERGRFAPDW